MDVKTEIRDKLNDLNSEHAILALFIGVSTYMFVRAQAWNFDTRVFPQAMAGAVIIGSLLLVFRNYLPGPLQKIVVEGGTAFDGTEELGEELDETADNEEEDEEEPVLTGYDRPLNPVVSTAILITAYAAMGYLFSLFIVSPLFVAAYLIWFRQPWPVVVLLSLLSLLVAYAFVSLIIVPIDRGVLVGDLLWIGGVI